MGRRKARLLCAPDLLHAHCSRHGRPWHVEVVGRDSSSSIASRRKQTLEMNEVGVEGHVVLIPRAKKALHRSLRAIKWLISQFCQNFVKKGLSGFWGFLLKSFSYLCRSQPISYFLHNCARIVQFRHFWPSKQLDDSPDRLGWQLTGY